MDYGVGVGKGVRIIARKRARERMGLSVGVDEIGRGSVGRVVGCNLFVTFVADTPM